MMGAGWKNGTSGFNYMAILYPVSTLILGYQEYLGGGFKYFLFSTLFGEHSHFH